MRLTLLGTGTAIPVPHRGPTALWLAHRETEVLVDCGAGAIEKLYRAGGDLNRLDAVLLSHAHLDHIGDLTTLLFALRMPGHGRTRPLKLIYSRKLAAYLAGLRQTFGDWLVPRGFDLVDTIIEPGQVVQLENMWITAFEVAHHASSLGYHIAARPSGGVVAIPGDTGLSPTVITGVRGADCLVLECSAVDGAPLEGHLCPREVVEIVAQAEPHAVVLTHFYPEAERQNVAAQIAARVAAHVIEGMDGLELEVQAGGVGEPQAARPPTESSFRPSRPPAAKTSAAKTSVAKTSATKTPVTAPTDEHFEWASPTPDEADIHAMIEADLKRRNPGSLGDRKYGGGSARKQRRKKPVKPAAPRRWKAEDLERIRLTKPQRRLLKRSQKATIPTLHLRGSTVEQATAQLEATVRNWCIDGQSVARVVTGKGKQSEGAPVVKLAVLNWLEAEGLQFVHSWAPEITQDGRFGSILLSMRSGAT